MSAPVNSALRNSERALQTQMQLGTDTDLDGAANQPVVECMPAVVMVLVDEVRVVAGH